MRATVRFRRSALAAAVSLGLAAGFAGRAIAEDIPGHVFTSPADDRMVGAQYFIDFRARRGAVLGHTFIAYGRLGAGGRLLDVEYAGNYPADEMGLIVGMVIPVPTLIGPVKGDMTEPATIIYRRKLTAAQFARVKAAVRHLRKTRAFLAFDVFQLQRPRGRGGKGDRTAQSALLDGAACLRDRAS